MREQIIGILGGMGPEATVSLYADIIRATPAEKDQDHLRVLMDSNPKIPDRTRAILAGGPDPVPAMVESGRLLAAAGADFIVMPCISAHYYLTELQERLDIPILSAFDAVAQALSDRHPPLKTVGLLATSGTLQGGRFAARLKQDGLETLAPEAPYQERVMAAIYGIKSSGDKAVRDRCRQGLLEAAGHLLDRGAQGIIAGCTEIPLELKPHHLPVPLFDPLRILAEAAVRRALPVGCRLPH